MSTEQDAIRELLARLNDAWMHKRGDAMTEVLTGCFVEDVVMRGSGFVLVVKGREALVRSYGDFVAQAEIRNVSLDPPEIDVAGETATAVYKWDMTYALSGQEYTEHGYDMFVLSRSSGQWLVVWRAMLPEEGPK